MCVLGRFVAQASWFQALVYADVEAYTDISAIRFGAYGRSEGGSSGNAMQVQASTEVVQV